MSKAELQELLISSGVLSSHASTIAELASECLELETEPVNSELEIPIGASKVGGNPDLPREIEWPTVRNSPLIFLAQVSLADLPHLEATLGLPQSGLLSFFYDANEQPWGFDPKHGGSWKVVYIPNAEKLQRREHSKSNFKACSLTSRKGWSLPSWERAGANGLDLNEEEMDALEEVSLQLRSSGHQLLGLPVVVQSDDMELECQLASNGIYCGDPTGYDSPRAKAISSGSEDWLLLMQFESDEKAGMMWGDGGRLYFWIRRQDLVSQNFDNAWVVLQCY